MEETMQFLREAKTFYLATASKDGQPHVRPFGAVCIFDGHLYFVTNNQKNVYSQIIENPKVALCGMDHGKWIRVEGTVEEDLRRETRVAMMEENEKALSSMYTVDDNLMTVFRFMEATATIYSFTDEPEVHTF